MTKQRVAQFVARGLMALGLFVGALGVSIWAFDIRIEVPDWMWRIAVAKLVLAGSAGMLATGAILLRQLRRRDEPHVPPIPELNAPDWEPTARERQRAGSNLGDR